MELTGANTFDRHLSVLKQKQLEPVALYFWKENYVFKEQSAAPDPVRNSLFIGTDHTRAEKYQRRVLLERDRRIKSFFFYSKAHARSGAVEGVFWTQEDITLRLAPHTPNAYLNTKFQNLKFSKSQKRAWTFRHICPSGLVQSMFSELRRTIRFFWYPISLV